MVDVNLRVVVYIDIEKVTMAKKTNDPEGMGKGKKKKKAGSSNGEDDSNANNNNNNAEPTKKLKKNASVGDMSEMDTRFAETDLTISYMVTL